MCVLACGKSSPSIVGRWSSERVHGSTHTIEFKADETYFDEYVGGSGLRQRIKGKYKVEGKNLSVYANEIFDARKNKTSKGVDEILHYSISGDVLTLEGTNPWKNDRYEVIDEFKRVK